MLKSASAITFFIAGLVHVTHAQSNLQGRFVTGSFSGYDQFRIDASETPGSQTSFSRAESHQFSTSLGYGFFYREKRSVQIGFNTTVSYNSSDGNKNWWNGFGGYLNKSHYYAIASDKLWLSLGQEFTYQYGYNRGYGNSVRGNNPLYTAHAARFTLNPGILFKPGRRLLLTLYLPFIHVGVTRRRDYQSSSSTLYSYDVSGVTNITSIQFGLNWMPDCLQKKKP